MKNLPFCSYRVTAVTLGEYFFCRHPRVHAPHNLVNRSVCQICVMREQPAAKLRPLPQGPLRLPQDPTGPWRYISLEQLSCDVRRLASRLPANLTAVAGIPRSGMIPASMLACLLHLPLLEVSPAEGLRPMECGHRLQCGDGRMSNAVQEPLLVIDDSVSGGEAIQAIRVVMSQIHMFPEVIFAAVYPRPETAHLVDLYAALVPTPHLFEWNLFNCRQTERFAFDMDGVLCEDWPGGDEDGPRYQQFLDTTSPLWLPRRKPVPLIVTARLEKHRPATMAWLARHGVEVRQLIMGPWESAHQRRRHYDAGRHKGEPYAASRCRLFIESDERQAKAIFQASGKPVLCISSGKIYQ